ncbi:hypothetical protein K470DRAFT_254236 [Piedraia hortae CBS 480.64]|uniref:Large ribosomal subunit protein bL32m n=1 Tax=Piedraia hortae CBS 480.64 TaxID=1314780 RepID=A0A6A7C9J9_9PEZI|nr:hypothetical protein K470DRAFT_254236 [Piedraia hortae CBS 480.64]
MAAIALRRIPLLHQVGISLLPPALVPIPSFLGQLWNGLLNAVPKKKTSHMKKRHRQMAGKALKDATALNRCSACGRQKRAHVLCPYCVASVRKWISTGFATQEQLDQVKVNEREQINRELKQRGQKPIDWEEREREDERVKGEKYWRGS